ncbi:MAG: Hsp20 family protein, partial [Bacillota bacterium]
MFSYPMKTNPRKNQVSLYNMFDDFFNDLPLFSKANEMKIDVRETDKEYLIDAEIPGMKKDNINIDVEENQLIISAYEE